MSRSRLIATSRGPVEYAEHGSGTPLLSFHGTPGGFDGALLAAEMQCGSGFHHIGFSRPGYLATPLSSGSSVPEQADLAAALLDSLAVPKALLFGLSGGGPYALAFAARHPSRCLALLLAAPVTAREARSSKRLNLEIALLSALDWFAWIVPAIAPRSNFARILEVITPFRPRAAGYRNDAVVFGNFAPIPFEHIVCPTLIVHGTADRIASYPDARKAAARIANCQTLFVRGAGHLTAWTRPEVTKQVVQFLNEAGTQFA